ALPALEGTDFALYRVDPQAQGGIEVAFGEEIVPISSLSLDALRANRAMEGRVEVSGDEYGYVIRPLQGRPRSLLVLRREVRLAPEVTRAIGSRFIIAALLAIGIAAAVAFFLAGRFSKPLRQLASATSDIARGRFDRRVHIESKDEIGAVATSFNRMAGELGDADKRQREFFLSISHELRTPLTAIQGYAEAIEDGTAGPQRVTEAAGVIAGESRRLARLVTDLLELARIDAKRFDVALEDVEIDSVLNSTQQAFAPKAQEAGVEIVVESNGGIVKADPDRLMQVLSNLTENALRYTPASRRIILSSDIADGSARIVVRDGGMGFESEDLSRAFDRQYLWSKYRGLREVGTGLGLAITKELVEAMGGSVQAKNASGGGAEFTVNLTV
ncbi:MAG: sensor histidine kinase, partial [Acidimicrobiia bacterium]